MRSVSARARGAAFLILLVALTAVPAFADDPPPGTEPMERRLQPPVGIASQAEEASDRRLRPPMGVASEGRIQPPGGITDPEEPPSVWELFLVWLQSRIHVPVG